MNPLPLAWVLLLSLGPSTRGDESLQFFYSPVPTALTGTIAKDPGGNAWILRLERPITVNPEPGSGAGRLEQNVAEVELAPANALIEGAAAKKGSVTLYGKLVHAAKGTDARPVRMEVSGYQPVMPQVREIRPSPDGQFYVAWLDHDAGPPIGKIRSILLRPATDQESLFSLVSSPRDTRAAWNPGSTHCVIADAPDNGGPRTWLISKPPAGHDEWQEVKINPFAALEKAHYEADPGVHHLFRPSFSKIEWLSETRVRFHARCNSGSYLLTLDVTAPEKAPETQKLPDEPSAN